MLLFPDFRAQNLFKKVSLKLAGWIHTAQIVALARFRGVKPVPEPVITFFVPENILTSEAVFEGFACLPTLQKHEAFIEGLTRKSARIGR